jgi:phage tail sheath protein FI
MAEQFLHGVEVLEIDSGPRPIETVRSAVIGIVGTAPDSAQEVDATLTTGVVASNNALTWTSKLAGVLGNKISIKLVDPKANSAALSISVASQAITVNLATNSSGVITTTASALITAIGANTNANALVAVASTGASTGASAVAALPLTFLSGGVDEAFPLDTPVMIAGSRVEAAKLGSTGTLPAALDSIFDQAGAVVVVVRVAKGANDAETLANVIGGVNSSTGNYEGMYGFLGAESALGVAPRILIAPGFTHTRTSNTANATVAEMIGIAERLRAVIIADGPSTTDAAAVAYAGDFGSKRVYLVDPRITKLDENGSEVYEWSSPAVAGLIAKSDNERGFWWSPSNQNINGIIGTERKIDFAFGDTTSRANLLNEAKVATIIRQDGYRLWGNRTLSADPKWVFLSVVRTADIIHDSLQRAHRWAVDRNITKTYVQDVIEGVNNYLRHLQAIGAILGGQCWADPDLNAPDQIALGKVYFDFDFTPPYPAERITFRSHLTNDYIKNIFA